MSWKVVKSKSDIDYLNEIYDNFHDSYLNEICFHAGDLIQSENSNVTTARLLFEREWKNPSIIEIEFREVIQINIKPEGKNQFRDIIVSHLYFNNDIFFWSAHDYEFHEKEKDNYTWIAAKFVRWRVRDNLLGCNRVYIKN